LLLLDEPWTGLDRKSAGLLETIVRQEAARGAIVAVVSHEPGLTERLGAENIQIKAGQVQA
jgi:ABC-type multidrug transport system ATPase subunit